MKVEPKITINLLTLPVIGPWLCRLLGGGIGPRKDSRGKTPQTKGG